MVVVVVVGGGGGVNVSCRLLAGSWWCEVTVGAGV